MSEVWRSVNVWDQELIHRNTCRLIRTGYSNEKRENIPVYIRYSYSFRLASRASPISLPLFSSSTPSVIDPRC